MASNEQVTSRVRTAVWLLQAGSAVVLVIVCVNVASLLIGRTTARRRELAVRRAVGATSGHLASQLLIEIAVLGTVAAALGVATALGAVRVIDALAPADLPRVNEIRLDPIVWTFMLGISVLITAIVGVVMAWRSTRVAAADAARDSTRTTSASRSALAMRSLLVATQIGLSAVSLVVAGLLLHSFANLMQVDKGFDAERLLSVDVTLSPARYPNLQSTTAFVRALLAELSSQRGIASAGVVSQPPLAGVGGNNRLLTEGNDPSPSKTPIVDFRPMSPEYFQTRAFRYGRGACSTTGISSVPWRWCRRRRHAACGPGAIRSVNVFASAAQKDGSLKLSESSETCAASRCMTIRRQLSTCRTGNDRSTGIDCSCSSRRRVIPRRQRRSFAMQSADSIQHLRSRRCGRCRT